MQRVLVTGLGAVTPLAAGAARSFQAVLAGSSGVVGAAGCSDDAELQRQLTGLPSQVLARVPPQHWTAETSSRAASPPRVVQLAVQAAREAVADAGLSGQLPATSTGVAIGSGIGALDLVCSAAAKVSDGKPRGFRSVSPYFIPHVLLNSPASAVALDLGVQGPNLASATACAAGAHSIVDAARLIATGEADVMLAGASEACLTRLAIAGFCQMRALSTRYNDTPDLASRPFDQDRDGFVIGEGAGILVLESERHAAQRGARGYACVAGYGVTGDAHHIAAPPPDGEGAARAMQQALRHAGVDGAECVGLINAHATSTPLGDAAECRAIHRVMQGSRVSVTSTKGSTGHLLGAAGAVEAVFTVLSLHHRSLPPTRNVFTVDPVAEECSVHVVAGAAESMSDAATCAMSNSFGFGGTNVSLVFTAP